MKKLLTVSMLLSSAAFAQATEPSPAPVTPAAAPVVTAPAALPKQVHIVVGEFKCGSYNCNGAALADALTNALMDTDRFAVYERAELGQAGGEGLITGVDLGSQIQGADLLVIGTVSAYGQDAGSGDACFMGVCLGAKSERVVANLRIFDIKTSRVLGSVQVEGKSTGASGRINLAGLSLGGSQNTGMEKAVAAMLNDAVQKLSAKIPANYYR